MVDSLPTHTLPQPARVALERRRVAEDAFGATLEGVQPVVVGRLPMPAWHGGSASLRRSLPSTCAFVQPSLRRAVEGRSLWHPRQRFD